MTDFVSLLGVKGGPSIRPGSNMPTSILLRLDDATILVDAGLGVSKAVCDQGVALTEIDAIFITHLHSDHYLELGPLLHTAWVSGRGRPLDVYGPTRLQNYWDAFLNSMEDDIV
ncbi:MAG: MBL fold metallo-hydrolase, partial [Pseudomonadota bacterium]